RLARPRRRRRRDPARPHLGRHGGGHRGHRGEARMTPPFDPVTACWVCGGGEFVGVHEAIFELSEYVRQDPELAAYSGARVTLQRCRGCGFAQPAALPALPNYFDRMCDQRWADDWIAGEHDAGYKDRIFADILDALGRRVSGGRALLDVGAH